MQETIDRQKHAAAEKALDYINDGMTVGLGTGTTFQLFVKKLALRVKEGLDIKTVSTSNSTTELASSLGIKVSDFSEAGKIDVTIDGADEVDHDLNGIKGGGGALLYEKIIASSSLRNIWMINSVKYVKRLGKFPLPVETVPFGAEHTFKELEEMGLNPKFRMKGKEFFISDGNHFIIDIDISRIDDIYKIDGKLKSIPGVVETGLFLNLCSTVIIGKDDSCEVIERA